MQKQQQSNGKHQTPPLANVLVRWNTVKAHNAYSRLYRIRDAPWWVSLSKRPVLVSLRENLPWRHPRSRKYITYCNAKRNIIMDTCQCKNSCLGAPALSAKWTETETEKCFLRYANRHRQTDRHADRNSSLFACTPTRGGEIITRGFHGNNLASFRKVRYLCSPWHNKTSCRSTDSERPHRCCHLPNKVENIDRRRDIPYTLQWPGNAPKNCFSP